MNIRLHSTHLVQLLPSQATMFTQVFIWGTFHVKWDQKYTISDLNSLDFFQIKHTDTTLDTIMQEKFFSQKVSQPVNYTHSKF